MFITVELSRFRKEDMNNTTDETNRQIIADNADSFKVGLSDLLAAIQSYNKRNHKFLYLTLYQDGSGYLGEEVGIHSEIEFEFKDMGELLQKLGG